MGPVKAREQLMTKRVKQRMTKAGIYHWKISDRYRRGMPDFLIVVDGKSIFLELKSEGREPTALQAREGERLQEAGVTWMCIDTDEALHKLLTNLERWHAETMFPY